MVTIAWEGTRTKRLRADSMFLQLFSESVKFWCGQKLDLGVLAEGYLAICAVPVPFPHCDRTCGNGMWEA